MHARPTSKLTNSAVSGVLSKSAARDGALKSTRHLF